MVVVVKRFRERPKKQKVTPERRKQFVTERVVYLKDKLAHKRQELADAEWNDEMDSTIARLRSQVEMLERQIALGETIEMPF